MSQASQIDHAVAALRRGGVIAYPTEAVWGLGCDPDNDAAVTKLLRLKRRDPAQGALAGIPVGQAIVAGTVAADHAALDAGGGQQGQHVVDQGPAPPGQQGLVAAHAPAGAAGQHQADRRREGGGRRRRIRVHAGPAGTAAAWPSPPHSEQPSLQALSPSA